MITLITFFFFFLGLIIGSFLNVVVFRFNAGKTFGGRSQCMHCQKVLYWYELIPLFSYLCLRGRCRGCQTRISKQYPIVELVSGLIFAALFLKYQDIFLFDTLSFSISYAYYATLFSILLVVAAYDIRHKIIPDTLSIVFGALAFLGLFLFSGDIFNLHIPSWLDLLSGIFLASPFALLWLVSKGAWMGLGDAKIALGLGWLLGFSRLLSGAVLSFWSGAIVGLLLILFRKGYGAKTEIPFAPFLFLGTLIAFLFELRLFYF